MRLHEDKEVFYDAIVKASEIYDIREIYIEKDYWVSYALKTIFSSSIGKECVFKGGTSLSKCFGLIDRFSEDIDIVVLNKSDESGSYLKKKLKAVSSAIGNMLHEVEVKGITNKKGQLRKIAYEYDKISSGNFGQVRDKIILESSIFGFYEPSSDEYLNSLIADMIHDRGLDDLVDKEILQFFEGEEFFKMLLRVGNDDKEKYINNSEWIDIHPSEAIVFSDVEACWKKVGGSYRTSFAEMVYGNLPDENLIIESMSIIAKRLKDIEWKLNTI